MAAGLDLFFPPIMTLVTSVRSHPCLEGCVDAAYLCRDGTLLVTPDIYQVCRSSTSIGLPEILLNLEIKYAGIGILTSDRL